MTPRPDDDGARRCGRCGNYLSDESVLCYDCENDLEQAERDREADERYYEETGYWPGERP